jgi:hypothetical protein
MSVLSKIKLLNLVGDVRISEHGYDELANDGLFAREVVQGINDAELVEEYTDFPKGESVLCLQHDVNGYPYHAVWGIPKGYTRPAVLITAYRPDPKYWDTTFKIRKVK